jgi:hypothetical protein
MGDFVFGLPSLFYNTMSGTRRLPLIEAIQEHLYFFSFRAGGPLTDTFDAEAASLRLVRQ